MFGLTRYSTFIVFVVFTFTIKGQVDIDVNQNKDTLKKRIEAINIHSGDKVDYCYELLNQYNSNDFKEEVAVIKVELFKALLQKGVKKDSLEKLISEIELTHYQSLDAEKKIEIRLHFCDFYLKQQLFDEVFNQSKEIEKLKEESNNALMQSLAITGIVYDRLEDADKSREYYGLAIQESKKNNLDSVFIAKMNRNLAISYLHDDLFDSAITYINKGILFNPNDLRIRMIKSSIYTDLEEYDKAKEGLNGILILLDKKPELSDHIKRDKAYVYKLLGYLHYSLKEYEQARLKYNVALSYTDTLDFPERILVLKGLIASHLENNEDLVSELVRLFENEKKESVLEKTIDLETKYKVAEKDKRIEQYRTQQIAEQYLKKERQLFYVTLILLLGLISGGIFIYFQYQRFKTKQKVNELHAQSLRLQINPHFFFNALNSINSYIGENKHLEAKRYLSKFAKVMRAALESVHDPISSIEEELVFVENYLDVQKMQYKYFDYNIQIDPNIDVANLAMPSLIVQPYLENAIIHGLKNKTEQDIGQIEINLKLSSEQNLVFEIIDNGDGLTNTNDANKEHKSLALTINKKRIEAFSKKHGKVEMLNRSYENGVKVSFQIPQVKL